LRAAFAVVVAGVLVLAPGCASSQPTGTTPTGPATSGAGTSTSIAPTPSALASTTPTSGRVGMDATAFKQLIGRSTGAIDAVIGKARGSHLTASVAYRLSSEAETIIENAYSVPSLSSAQREEVLAEATTREGALIDIFLSRLSNRQLDAFVKKSGGLPCPTGIGANADCVFGVGFASIPVSAGACTGDGCLVVESNTPLYGPSTQAAPQYGVDGRAR
jgi:hypothetical protein